MIRNILAVVAGILIGGVVNMALVRLGLMAVSPPAGADLTTAEGITAAMPLLEAKHFLFPFLAHAIGTLAGAYAAARIATDHRMTLALIVGVFFLIGGVTAAFMIPAPVWFLALDLIVAYIPMAWLGWKLAARA